MRDRGRLNGTAVRDVFMSGCLCRGRRPLVQVLIGTCAVLSVNSSSAQASIAAGLPSATSTIQMPADAAADPEANFSAISCSSDGNCAAVGAYTPNGGTEDANSMAVVETNGTWGRAVEPAPPANGQAGSVLLNDVACAPGGVCTAVGSYQDTTSDGDAMVVSETNGVWGAATEITVPANGDTFPYASLSAISCGAVGSCAAVGTYQAYSSSPSIYGSVPLAVSETGGQWGTGVSLTIPNPNMYYGLLTAVSCPPTGACVATGQTSSADEVQVFATSGTSAGWSNGTVLTGPSGAGAMYVQSLSCPAAGDCSAVGWDQTSSPGATPITGDEVVDSKTGGSWTTASTLTLPSVDTGAASAALVEVSCWTAGNCRALGGVTSGDTAAPNTFVTQTNGVWGAATAYSAGLANSLSCPPSGACVAVGIYGDATTQTGVAGAFDYANGTWSAPVNVTSPADAAQNNGELFWVSCAPDGSCGAVGNYTNAAGDQLAMGTSVIADSSTTTVACSPSASNDVCTATVTGNTTSGAPTGAVSFSTTAGTFPAGATCSLVSTGPATSSCEVTFTAPGANSTNNPTITAVYGGDGAYASSSGKTTLCGDGADLEISSVNAVGRHDYGIEINGQAILTGCGLAAGQTVQWGNEDATETLAASDISDGGASATVAVPWEATSGDVSVSDGTTTSTVADNTIDSWRNTMGFSFHNYEDYNVEADLIKAFTGSATTTTVTGGTRAFLAPGPALLFAAHSLDQGSNPMLVGRCFGIALLTSQFADGSAQWDQYGAAATPYGLSVTGSGTDVVDLQTDIQVAWWKQFSSKANQDKKIAPTTAAALRSQLTAAFGTNGFTHPALISFKWQKPGVRVFFVGGHQVTRNVIDSVGHTVTAFAVRSTPTDTDPGRYTIYTYDSNSEFLPAEDSSAALHAAAQSFSEIVVDSNGDWSSSEEDASGSLASGYLWVAPVSSLEGPQHLDGSPAVVAMDVSSGAVVAAAYSPVTGAPVDLSGNDLGGLQVTANETTDTSARARVADTSAPGAAVAGTANIAEITGPAGNWRDALVDPEGEMSTIWRSGSTWASLQANVGTDVTDFTAKTGALSLAEAPHVQPSSRATVAIYANSDDDRDERVVTVTGPLARMGATVALHGSSAVVQVKSSGSLQIELSKSTPGGGNTYALGSVAMVAGQTLRATPTSWAALQNSSGVSVELSGAHRPARHLTIKNNFRATAATLVSGRLTGRTLRLLVKVPSALRGGEILISATVRHGGRKVSQVKLAVTVAKQPRQTIVLKLKHPAPKRSVALIVLKSLSVGATPGTATRTSKVP
jgi:hypothetical protein